MLARLPFPSSNGYVFDHWSGDASGYNPKINIVMNSNKTVVANFVTEQTWMESNAEFKVDNPYIASDGLQKIYPFTIKNISEVNISASVGGKITNLQGVTVGDVGADIIDIWPGETYYNEITTKASENVTLKASIRASRNESVGGSSVSPFKTSKDFTILETMPISIKKMDDNPSVTIKNNSTATQMLDTVQIRLYDSKGRLRGVKHQDVSKALEPSESRLFLFYPFYMILGFYPNPSELSYVVRVLGN